MNIERVDGIMLPGIGPGTVALLEGDTHAGPWVKQFGRLNFDEESLRATAKLVGSDGVIWDIGAMIGAYACGYAGMAKEVLAVEARDDAFVCLQENVLCRYSNVQTLCAVVGDGSLAKVDDSPVMNAGARRMIVSHEMPSVSGSIFSVQLDILRRTRTAPTLIKMDIEGWEVKALVGATKILTEDRPTMILEVNRRMLDAAGDCADDIAVILGRYRYLACDIFTREAWNPSDDCPQRDIVCWPVEKVSPWK